MTSERWRQVEEIFRAALASPLEERSAFLKRACEGDDLLRGEVESLIDSYEQAESFLETPAVAAAAHSLLGVRAESLAGRVIGHYQVITLLGEGGMGEVYTARDTRLGRRVALKLLPGHAVRDADRLRRFEREARAASALSHPNVCMIHEVGETEGGRHYIVMEYVEGATLRRHMGEGPLALGPALDISIQVASALAAAHEAGVVHRDVKPENIMLRRDGYVKVLDFGLAKLTGEFARQQAGYSATSASSETGAGLVMGTAAYMSPEQARGLEVDGRTDVWSLGVVLYEVVTGRAPFEGATNSDVIASILGREPAPLTSLSPGAPAELRRIVAKALRKERDERYQTVKDMLLDLKSLKEELEVAARLEHSSQPGGRAGAAGDGGAGAGRVGPAGPPSRTGEARTTRPASGRRKSRLTLLIVTLAVVAASATYGTYLIYQRLKVNPQPPRRALSRLTFDAGLQSEPTWSPDGRFIAFSADRGGNFDIWVQPAGGGDAVQVTKSPAHDWQPDWSPDGSRVVFRSEREGGGLFVIPALGGRESKISSFGYRPRWSPDGSSILFTDSIWDVSATSVYVVTLDGGAPRKVLPESLAGLYLIQSVVWHPDGRRFSFSGTDRKLMKFVFWTVRLDGGAPVKSEISAEVNEQLRDSWFEKIGNFRWSPSGQSLYFEGVTNGIRNLWKVAVDPETLRWVNRLERLTTGLGSDTDIALSPDGKKLAFTTRIENVRLWSLPFDARSGRVKGDGQPVTASGIIPEEFSLTADGKKLAFFANQAGTHKRELWERRLEEGRETLLAVNDSSYGSPRWSRDGTRLAYVRYRSPHAGGKFDTSIVTLPEGGGDEQQLTSEDGKYIPLDWSNDGRWILISSSRLSPGRTQIDLLPVSAAPRAETGMRVVASSPEYDLYQARLSPDDRWVCFEAVQAGSIAAVYVVATSGGEWTRITDAESWNDKPRWSPDGKTIYFVSNRATGFLNVWGRRFDPAEGKPVGEPFRVTSFESPVTMVWPSLNQMEIAVSGDRLVLPIMEVTGAIWVLDNVDR